MDEVFTCICKNQKWEIHITGRIDCPDCKGEKA